MSSRFLLEYLGLFLSDFGDDSTDTGGFVSSGKICGGCGDTDADEGVLRLIGNGVAEDDDAGKIGDDEGERCLFSVFFLYVFWRLLIMKDAGNDLTCGISVFECK